MRGVRAQIKGDKCSKVRNCRRNYLTKLNNKAFKLLFEVYNNYLEGVLPA